MTTSRRTLCSACFLLVAVGFLGPAVSSFATDTKIPLPPKLDATRSQVDASKIKNEHLRAAVERRNEKNLRQFKDKNGVLTLTNRGDKYVQRPGYVEMAVKLEPIRIAPRFRKLQATALYTPKNIAEIVTYYSKLYGVPEKLVYAVIRAESNFNPNAVSSAGARGLMQLMPDTAADMGVTDIFDPAQNIAGGTQYLAKMLTLFDNNLEFALAAYNAGPNAVKASNGIPPYPETQQYVRSIVADVGDVKGTRPKVIYAVRDLKPKADALPLKTANCYMIHFRSGYTQPADKIIDEDPYYYVQFGNRTALVRKEHVEKIVEPA